MTSPLLRTAELRALEARHADLPLMARAGAAAAGIARDLLGRRHAPVLVLAGPGNNGGDARVMATVLRKAGVRVVLVDAAAGHDIPAGDYGLVVDGLFGIGLTRAIDGDHARLIERINAFPGPVLALDVPSGLDGDTGRILGVAVRATHTATFIAGKPGLHTLDGPDHCGAISVHSLDIPLPQACGTLLERGDFAAFLTPRARNSHKGSFGALAVLGGAPGMSGAALLAARAGLQLGAGRVFVGLLERLALDPLHAELMLRAPDDALAQASCAVIGPGLGDSAEALRLLRRLASADFPVLFDADALNLLARHPVLAAQVGRRTAATVLTPHPAEAARLLATTTAAIQDDRIAAAQQLARRFNAVVALKGCGTVLAHPDGRWRINTSGNPGLASGGTGDVLAGIAGALLAQHWPAWEALCAAVHLHGAAADRLAERDCGPIGLCAGELIPTARTLLNRWILDD